MREGSLKIYRTFCGGGGVSVTARGTHRKRGGIGTDYGGGGAEGQNAPANQPMIGDKKSEKIFEIRRTALRMEPVTRGGGGGSLAFMLTFLAKGSG